MIKDQILLSEVAEVKRLDVIKQQKQNSPLWDFHHWKKLAKSLYHLETAQQRIDQYWEIGFLFLPGQVHIFKTWNHELDEKISILR